MISFEKMLDGKAIVIYGGTKGIGRGVALEAARQGADVMIGGRDENAAAEIIRQIKSLGRKAAFAFVDPISDPDSCRALIEKTAETFGRLDGLFNYAGITPIGSLTEATAEQFNSVMQVNVMGTMLVSGAAVAYMREHGGGSIVMTGSLHAWRGEKDRIVYAMSKGAQLTLVEHIAKHYAADHIRCNLMTIGWAPTDGEIALRAGQGMSKEELYRLGAEIMPMGRLQEIEDHVPAVIYYLSDLSGQVTGSNIKVSGGFSI